MTDRRWRFVSVSTSFVSICCGESEVENLVELWAAVEAVEAELLGADEERSDELVRELADLTRAMANREPGSLPDAICQLRLLLDLALASDSSHDAVRAGLRGLLFLERQAGLPPSPHLRREIARSGLIL
jgi:hypothetical protein